MPWRTRAAAFAAVSAARYWAKSAGCTNAAVEFINMMVTIDRLPAAARVLDYLGAAGDFGALAARTLVADSAARIAANPEPIPDHDPAPEPRLDDRRALTQMRDVLDEL